MKCPHCGKAINLKKAARELASKGGKTSRRVLTPEQARDMALKSAEARRKKNDVKS